MLIIDLIRHVKVDGAAALYGKTDVAPLVGENELLLKQLINKPSYDVIICSPLQRCSSIAIELAQQLSKPLIYENALQEINFGLYDGIAFDLIPLVVEDETKKNGLGCPQLSDAKLNWSLLEAYFQAPADIDLPEAESLTGFHQRVTTAWTHLIKQQYHLLCGDNKQLKPNLSKLKKPKKAEQLTQAKRIAIIAHGGVIRMILAEILAVDWTNAQWHQNLAIPHGSVSTIAITQPFKNGRLLQQVKGIAIPLCS